MFVCYLCGEEYVISTYHCNNCIEISRIVKLIGSKQCKKILTDICLRETTKQDLKVDKLVGEMNKKKDYNESLESIVKKKD